MNDHSFMHLAAFVQVNSLPEIWFVIHSGSVSYVFKDQMNCAAISYTSETKRVARSSQRQPDI